MISGTERRLARCHNIEDMRQAAQRRLSSLLFDFLDGGADDAKRAVEAGFDGIIVSNHGGRQLDQAPAPIEVLAEIVAAVDGRAEVILDGGIRRGTDVLKALALGAKACMTGRPFLYGLAAGGPAGVERAFEILAGEIRRDMMLAGCPTIEAIGADLVRRAD